MSSLPYTCLLIFSLFRAFYLLVNFVCCPQNIYWRFIAYYFGSFEIDRDLRGFLKQNHISDFFFVKFSDNPGRPYTVWANADGDRLVRTLLYQVAKILGIDPPEGL